MNGTRKSSPRTFKMEPTGPKVASRYLTGPTGSCHDHCKGASKQTTETKPINPLPKRKPKPPAERINIDASNLVPTTNRSPSLSPKTKARNFKNNNVVKDQNLKKDVAVEPKKRDFKMKSVNTQAKTYIPPPSRTPRRRLSDNFIPDKNVSSPSSRTPKRRLSEIIIPPRTNVASVSNRSTARGSGINKNGLGKDLKLPVVNKKSISVKTSAPTTKINGKVSPLRTSKSLPKPEVKGPRKSKTVKPVEELAHQETMHVIEPNIEVEITKIESQKSPSGSPSSSEVKAVIDDANEVVEALPPSMEDDTLTKDGQLSSFEVIATKDDQNEVLASSPPSLEVDTLAKDDKLPSSEVNSANDDQNEVVESSPPSLEVDTLAKDDQLPSSEVDSAKHDQNEVVESPPTSLEVDTLAKDDQLRSSQVNAANYDQNEVVESSPPSLEVDTLAKDDQLPSYEENAVKDGQNEAVESSPPSIEVETLAEDSQPSSPEVNAEKKDDQTEVVISLPETTEDHDTHANDGQPSSSEVESSSQSMHDDTLAKDGEENDNVSDSEADDTNETTHFEKLEVETNDCTIEDLKFKRGTILSPESENNRLIELQFTKGKELETETEEGVKISLRKLSSDGVVSIPESVPTVSVDLKHQEMEEKKAAVLSNNVIEETASKLIQARKSKVKALVGAFETIVTAETSGSN